MAGFSNTAPYSGPSTSQMNSMGGSSGSSGMSMGDSMSAIGTVAQVISSIMAANQAKRAGEFNQQMLAIQSKIYKTSADFESKRIREQAETLLSSQMASYVKSGVTIDGSPSEVMKKTYANKELDALVSQWNAKYMIGQSELQGRMVMMEAKQEAWNQYAKIPATLINQGSKSSERNTDWFKLAAVAA